jgi:hypothetical protein
MVQVTFRIKDDTKLASVVMFSDQGQLRYKVSLGKDHWFTIAPSGISGPRDRIIWLQADKPEESIQPHFLIQAIGEGIERLE